MLFVEPGRLAACPAHCQCSRNADMCHLIVFVFSINLAISLAESVFHLIHAARLSSAFSVPLVCLDILRHHLVRALSAAMIFARISGVMVHDSTPYSKHGFTSDCRSLILMTCDVDVSLNRCAFAWAAFHACLNLCLKECAESFLNAISWPRMMSAALMGMFASPSWIFREGSFWSFRPLRAALLREELKVYPLESFRQFVQHF